MSTKFSDAGWRKHLLYEYHWEWVHPQTPTTFALRGDRFKFIQYHGIWDTDELYDLESDPSETTNLIRDPTYAAVCSEMRDALDAELRARNAAQVPFGKKGGRLGKPCVVETVRLQPCFQTTCCATYRPSADRTARDDSMRHS